MKKISYLIVFCVCGMLFQTASAQISFRINISSQPLWGLTGYNHVEYYYLPDIDLYYCVPTHRYVYWEGDRWIDRPNLPVRYRNYNLYNTRKVVINEPRPYMRNNEYKMRYASSGNNSRQELIRDGHEQKYYQIKEHPGHSKWKENQYNRGQSKKNQREGD